MSLPTESDFSKKTWNRPLLGGTTKTGFSFGLPPIVTCPVVSPLCSSCYANDRNSYRFPDVKRGQLRRFAVAMSHGFTARMVAELTAAAIIAEDEGKRILRFRLHDSGDFFDLQYIESWLRIAERLAKVAPLTVAVWAPTRIWAAKAIPVRIGESEKSNPLPLLRELNAFPHAPFRPEHRRPRAEGGRLGRRSRRCDRCHNGRWCSPVPRGGSDASQPAQKVGSDRGNAGGVLCGLQLPPLLGQETGNRVSQALIAKGPQGLTLKVESAIMWTWRRKHV